jgi:Serine/threonine protein kinase
MALEAGQLFGNYRIVRLLGEGGFGEVYLAENPLIERRAAVKVLHTALARDAELVRRFLNEARAASAIRHRNIIEAPQLKLTPATAKVAAPQPAAVAALLPVRQEAPRDAGVVAPVVLRSGADSVAPPPVVIGARPRARLAHAGAGGSNRRHAPAPKETFPQFQRPATAPSGYSPPPASRRQDDPAGF